MFHILQRLVFLYILFLIFLHAHFFNWPIKLLLCKLIYINIPNMSGRATWVGTQRRGRPGEIFPTNGDPPGIILMGKDPPGSDGK